MSRIGRAAGWIVVTLGGAFMYGRSARKLDRLDLKMRAEAAYFEALAKMLQRRKVFHAKLESQFELVLPVLLARIMGTASPGTEVLGEALLGEFLESLTEEQITAIAKLLQDVQRVALFQLYDQYRKKWKQRRAGASEEGSGSANEAGGGESLGDAS